MSISVVTINFKHFGLLLDAFHLYNKAAVWYIIPKVVCQFYGQTLLTNKEFRMKSNKIIITCALCGGGTTRKQSEFLPLSPQEQAADAVKAVKAGAAVIHIHTRDANGLNTMETDLFVENVNTIRAALKAEGLDAIINVTTSGTKFPEDMRVAHLPILKPELCSYDPGTLNWANSYVFLNTPPFLERLGTLTQELDIKPELEIFDAGMIGNVEYYLKKGFLKGPLHYQLVLGVPGGMPGTVESIAYLSGKLPKDATWSITGIGKAHMPCILGGLAAGCDGLRVGLEDNVNLYKGVPATNEQLVKQAVEISKMAGREIATAQEAREILGVTKKVD